MNLLMLPERTLFLCDTYVNPDLSPEQLVEIAVPAADEVRRFSITPHVALLSHSSFGSDDTPSARKMRRAQALIRSLKRPFEVEGEMDGDVALSKDLLDQVFGDSALTRPRRCCRACTPPSERRYQSPAPADGFNTIARRAKAEGLC